MGFIFVAWSVYILWSFLKKSRRVQFWSEMVKNAAPQNTENILYDLPVCL